MGEGIEPAGNHLPQGNGVGIGGVHQSKAGVALGIVPTRFNLPLPVGDDRSTVTLTAGTRHGYDYSQRQWFKIKDAGPCQKFSHTSPL